MQNARLSVPRRCRLFWTLIVPHLVFAAAPAGLWSDNPNWSATVWQSSDGLPNNDLTGIAQTPDGYLWLATYSSLVRFDGVAFDPHPCNNLSPEPIDEIVALAPARDGGLWLGGIHGAIMHVGTPRNVVYSAGLPDRQVQAMAEDAQGRLWIAYRGGSVCRLDHGQIVPLTDADPDAARPNRAHHGSSFAIDATGRLWLAEDGRIGTFQADVFTPVFRMRSAMTQVAPARAGGIWICAGSMLFRSDEGRIARQCGLLPVARPDAEPTQLFEDGDGSVWIGTAQDGLFRFDGTHFEAIATSGTHITALLGDRQGNLWVGTRSGGLDRIRRRIVELQKPAPKSIRSVCEDTDGLIWAATEDGQLLCHDDDRWTTATARGLAAIGRVTSVAAGPDGALWIGTRDGALRRWQHGKLESWEKADGLIGHAIHALLVDRSGDVWIGGEIPDVVQRLHNGILATIPTPDGIGYIRAMTEDPAGNVWVGTARGGLLRIAAGRAVDETKRFNPTRRSIRCLYATPDGGVWIGYANKGLGWLQDGRTARISSPHAMPATNVSQIVADGRGWLWFAGDRGIFKARQSDLEAYARGRVAQVHYMRYGQSEALASLEANWGDSPGAARGADGRLWIPLRNGLAVVHPDRIRDDLVPPPVFIDRLAVDDRVVAAYHGALPVRLGAGVTRPESPVLLTAGHHRLEFDFTALSLDAPENVRFRYRLEGLDDEWIESGTERRALYTRLAPGRYRFHVQACSSSGVWNRSGATLAFEVAPFFWQTWWFRTAAAVWCIVLAATIARFVLLRRVHQKLRRMREQSALAGERARIARDLHDDFGTRLTELGLIAELDAAAPGSDADDSRRELIEHIRSMERDLDAIVWAVNPNNDSLDHLVGFICRATTELFERTGTALRLHVPEQVPAWPLSPELRHHLFMVVREAVGNVVKHAQATVATLTLTTEPGVFHFRLEDDGAGFVVSVALSGERNGLKNMRTRIEEAGGRLSLRAAPGGGTVVEGWVPLAPGVVLPPELHPAAPPVEHSRP